MRIGHGSEDSGIYDLIIDAKVVEKTEWGLTTVYRLVSDEPGIELKMTLTNSAVDLPLSEGDSVVIGVSCDVEEEPDSEEPFDVGPGTDGTSLLDPERFLWAEPFGSPGPHGRCPRCDNRGVTLDGEPCDCLERP